MDQLLALVIMVMVLSIPIFGMWIKHRKDVMKMQFDAASLRPPHEENRVAELEERVRVLERIVTDGGYDVATQIEALRDQRKVEALMESPQPKGGV